MTLAEKVLMPTPHVNMASRLGVHIAGDSPITLATPLHLCYRCVLTP